MGQIYVPAVKWILLAAVCAAVIGFGSSTRLASAYGVSVMGTMLVTTFLTFFVMSPTLDRIYDEAYKPYSEQKISVEEALNRGSDPLRSFMARQTRATDLALFARVARLEPDTAAADVPMKVLIPAFVTSELKTAFQIGFLVFVPFLLIDIIVASLLMSMGMMMVSPVLVALPFKLMLFVLADGWNLLMGSLVASFGT
jgi:flagellar biosynthetic protein FliP